MFWSKPNPPTDAAAATPAPAPAPTPAPAPAAESKPAPSSSNADRESSADKDLAALMAELDAEHKANALAARHAERVHITEEDKTGLETDMNCLTAFDEMFYCYSFGGQFLNIYRYGEFRDCSEKSADWRFCLKAKVRGEVAKRAMILQRNKEKAAKYKTEKSSEDIWKVRKTPLTDAFAGDIEEVTDGKLS
ncbi:hypothetical protein FPQ18DRAFT_353271 [Pyronema domesticum]|nr:hypothetical protein FPQ18DRAFT_353271 [Pyronema domesticum]